MAEEIVERAKEEVGPTPLFKSVMHSKDLAPLVLKRLDFKALLAYSHTYRMGYQVAKYYQWGKQLIDQNLIAYYLLDYVAFQNRFSDAVLRNLYLTLRDNRRFAMTELCDGTKNPIYYATYGESIHIPWHLAALLGRVDIILDLVKSNPHYAKYNEKHILSLLISATKHRVVYYLVFGQHFNAISYYFKKGYIMKADMKDPTIREDLLFAGGCAGVMDIREKLQAIYGCELIVSKREVIIIASGLMEGGHLRPLVKWMVDQRLSVVEILEQNPECLHHAAENGHRETVNYILSEIERHNILNANNKRVQFIPLELDSKGRSLLHYFSYHGWQAEFRKLALPVIQDPVEKSRSKLSLISRKSKKKMVKSIQLSPMQEDKDKNTPMHFALQGGQLSMLQFSQDQGYGKINEITDQYHTNALGIVIAAKRNHMIEPLIRQYKVDWKCINDFGFNLLLECSVSDNWEAFKLLCEMKDGSTPLFEDPLGSKTRTARLTLAHVAAEQAHLRFLRQLKIHCINLGSKSFESLFKSVDAKGNSILHAVCEVNYCIGMFDIFVEEFECNPRQENLDKKNAIHMILLDKEKNPDAVWLTVSKIVRKYGQDLLDIRVDDKRTIRELAKEAGKENLFEESLSLSSDLSQ